MNTSEVNKTTRKRKTSAERVSAYRKRQSESDPQFRAKENKRISELKKRQKANLLEEEKKEKRAQHAKNMRLWRQKQREKQQEQKDNPSPGPSKKAYRTPQSLGKAVRKLEMSLPKSPRKKKAAVSVLAKRTGVQLAETAYYKEGTVAHAMARDDEKLIRDFFFRTDIVYTAPGLKEEMTIWEDGKKHKLRKHYLVMYLREAYALFRKTYSNVEVGFSKFASLRPVNVLLLKDQSPDQCKCRIHENFILKLKGAGIKYDEKFWPSMLCCNQDCLDSNCWKGTCESCQVGKLLALSQEDAKMVTWKEWGKSESNRLSLLQKSGCVGELKEMIYDEWPSFQEHVRIKRIQARSFEKDKSLPSTHVLQCDFAMSYSCEYQDEVQSALWCRNSVTLFTAALYSKMAPCKSFLMVTNSQVKDKDTVYALLLKLVDSIDFKEGDNLVIYSDGPSSEFKNRYMVRLVSILAKRYGCLVEWKYFATSHGKGVVDGIGGAAKSGVRRKVMSKRDNADIVQCSTDFANVAKTCLENVTVIHVDKSEIHDSVQREKPWEDTKEAPRISKAHVIRCSTGSCELFQTDIDTVPLTVVQY